MPTVCFALSACNTSIKKKKSLYTWVYVLACNICLVSREKGERERREKEGRKQALRWNVIVITLKGNNNRYFWSRIWDIQISVCRKGSRPLEILCFFFFSFWVPLYGFFIGLYCLWRAVLFPFFPINKCFIKLKESYMNSYIFFRN